MPMKILNPNHESSLDLSAIWPNIAVMIMQKQGLKSITLTNEDCERHTSDDVCMAIAQDDNGLHLTLIPEAEGRALAKEMGGLPN